MKKLKMNGMVKLKAPSKVKGFKVPKTKKKGY